jgi:hypothetical protein
MHTISAPLVEAFKIAFDRLQAANIDWVLTGSMAFAIQGIPYEPNDIDIQTDECGAYRFGTVMAEFIVTPVHPRRDSTLVQSHFGRFVVNGVTIEVMGDMQKRAADGTWEPPPCLAALRRFVEFEGMRVPVLPLSFEAESYKKMQRFEKARVLAQWAASGLE